MSSTFVFMNAPRPTGRRRRFLSPLVSTFLFLSCGPRAARRGGGDSAASGTAPAICSKRVKTCGDGRGETPKGDDGRPPATARLFIADV